MTETMAGHKVGTVRQETLARGFAVLRIMFGLVYLSNAVAKLIDVGAYSVGPFTFNLLARPNARGILEGAAESTWLTPLGSLYQSLVLPNWGFFIVFLIIAEFAIAFGMLFGVATRGAALGALLLIGPIWIMLLNQNQYLWTYPVELIPLLVLAIVPTGRTAGLDGRLAARFGGRWPF